MFYSFAMICQAITHRKLQSLFRINTKSIGYSQLSEDRNSRPRYDSYCNRIKINANKNKNNEIAVENEMMRVFLIYGICIELIIPLSNIRYFRTLVVILTGY